jgi:hypothetical protein
MHLSLDRLLLLCALFLGTTLRFAPTLEAGFPPNDGGMFLSMIRDLQSSGYRIPAVTSYNFANYPYAYSPLGFYLASLLADLGFNEIVILRFLPALVSSLAILGVYLFATALTSRERAAWAALIYAFIPRSFTWLVMGGGLTRSLGFTALLFCSWAVLTLFQRNEWKWLGWSVLFGAIAVTSHPEAGLHTAVVCAGLWLWSGRTLRATLGAGGVAMGVGVISALWWGNVLMQHGFGPFASVLATGSDAASGFLAFSRFWHDVFVSDRVSWTISVLLGAGILWGVWSRSYFILALAIVPYLVEWRSAANFVFMPLSLLIAGMTLQLKSILGSWVDAVQPVRSRLLVIATTLLFGLLFADGYLFTFRLANTSLTPADRNAFAWVRANTPANSRFVILTGIRAPELDFFQEWFPVLAERQSHTTFQGSEWILGAGFYDRLRTLSQLQSCETAACVRAWLADHPQEFEYLLVRTVQRPPMFLDEIRKEPTYELVFEGDAALIFVKKR